MSSRKRAIKRARQRGEPIRTDGDHIATPAGEKRYGGKIGDPIRPAQRRYGAPEDSNLPDDASYRAHVRENVTKRLNQTQNLVRAQHDQNQALNDEIASFDHEAKTMSTVELRHHEAALNDVVDRKVNDTGHHKEIPAFHGEKRILADAWLTSVRQELVHRKMADPAIPEVGARPRESQAARARERQQRLAAQDRATQNAQNRAAARDAEQPKPEPTDRAAKDRARREYWDARNAAKAKDIASAPSNTPQWARDAAEELNQDAWVPDRKGEAAAASADAQRYAAVKKKVKEIAHRQGVPESEVYRAILSGPHGNLDPELRRAMRMAAGQTQKGSTEPTPVRSPITARPRRPAPPFMADPKQIQSISDDALKTYRDQMKRAASGSRALAGGSPRDQEIARKAASELRRAEAELYQRSRRKGKVQTRRDSADSDRGSTVASGHVYRRGAE